MLNSNSAVMISEILSGEQSPAESIWMRITAIRTKLCGIAVSGWAVSGTSNVNAENDLPRKSLETHPESPPVTALSSFGGPNGRIEE